MVKLNDELRRALASRPNEPVKIEDEQGNLTCYLISADVFHSVEPFLIDRSRREEELRRELQIGIDQFERGEVEEWDAESIKREGRERLKRESSAA